MSLRSDGAIWRLGAIRICRVITVAITVVHYGRRGSAASGGRVRGNEDNNTDKEARSTEREGKTNKQKKKKLNQ